MASKYKSINLLTLNSQVMVSLHSNNPPKVSLNNPSYLNNTVRIKDKIVSNQMDNSQMANPSPRNNLTNQMG